MKKILLFPKQSEKYSVAVEYLPEENINKKLSLFIDFPIEISLFRKRKIYGRYDSINKIGDTVTAVGLIELQEEGIVFEVKDIWKEEGALIDIDRVITCRTVQKDTALRFTMDFYVKDGNARSFNDYHFIVPGGLYNKNDTDLDGRDDYLGTFVQDYKDDRNPALSATAYSSASGLFCSLIRADKPVRDVSITREQIQARHFIHDTDIGSLGIAPSDRNAQEILLRCDYPFYERNSFCLNIDGSEWSAYKMVKPGTEIHCTYLLQFGIAENLTDASWQTTVLQMNRILHHDIKHEFTLEEVKYYRREMVNNSFREFPDKKDHPAGYFIHFSPRKHYGEHNILEYGFCGAQTLLSYVMLTAARENKNEEQRNRAIKTVDFFVDHCFAPSGLAHGIYDVDTEKFIYWWTGILFPFQYAADNRKNLENYLGEQIVAALSSVAEKLKKSEGNYCRSMVEGVYYLLKCYQKEKEGGIEHPTWLHRIMNFCDKMVALQNSNGSWYRGYTMEGVPIFDPPQWFGGSAIERESGVIFPAEILVELYRITKDRKYLESARQAAEYIRTKYVNEVLYVGGLNDTTHIKSVKIDAVGVMFAMRSMLMVYEETKDPGLLSGARDAGRILASWTYLWDIPFDTSTLLGKFKFKTTGWTGCDIIPACSYVDDEFAEFIPDLFRIAEYCKDKWLAILGKIVTLGMQHGLSMPQNMYDYSMPGVQCEGFLTSLWISDTTSRVFSGAAAKNKGDDNDTCNGLVNGQALYNLDTLYARYGTLDMDKIINMITGEV
jgi:hypothetical protein